MTAPEERPLRILVLAPILPPAVGGAATYFGGLLPLVAEHPDIESIVVITERHPDAPDLEVLGCLEIRRVLPTRVAIPHRTWLGHAASYAKTQAWFASHLPEQAEQLGANLVHVHTRFRGRAFFSALHRCHVPIVADLRDRRTVLAPWMRVADRLICVIDSVRDEAVTDGFPKGRTAIVRTPLVIPKALSADPEKAATDARTEHGLSDTPYVLSVGDVAEHKGIPELVDGFEIWRRDHPDVRLVIAGVNHGGPDMARRLEAAEGVTAIGVVPREQALALMAGAAVLVRPSHRSEGLPRVIQEAVAMGAKVIAPPGVPELDRTMPESVLREVTPAAIAAALEAAWQRDGPPALDLSAHDPSVVARSLVSVYRSAEGTVRW